MPHDERTAATIQLVNSLASIASVALGEWQKARATAQQSGITDEQLGEAHQQLSTYVDLEALVPPDLP